MQPSIAEELPEIAELVRKVCSKVTLAIVVIQPSTGIPMQVPRILKQDARIVKQDARILKKDARVLKLRLRILDPIPLLNHHKHSLLPVG